MYPKYTLLEFLIAKKLLLTPDQRRTFLDFLYSECSKNLSQETLLEIANSLPPSYYRKLILNFLGSPNAPYTPDQLLDIILIFIQLKNKFPKNYIDEILFHYPADIGVDIDYEETKRLFDIYTFAKGIRRKVSPAQTLVTPKSADNIPDPTLSDTLSSNSPSNDKLSHSQYLELMQKLQLKFPVCSPEIEQKIAILTNPFVKPSPKIIFADLANQSVLPDTMPLDEELFEANLYLGIAATVIIGAALITTYKYFKQPDFSQDSVIANELPSHKPTSYFLTSPLENSSNFIFHDILSWFQALSFFERIICIYSVPFLMLGLSVPAIIRWQIQKYRLFRYKWELGI